MSKSKIISLFVVSIIGVSILGYGIVQAYVHNVTSNTVGMAQKNAAHIKIMLDSQLILKNQAKDSLDKANKAAEEAAKTSDEANAQYDRLVMADRIASCNLIFALEEANKNGITPVDMEGNPLPIEHIKKRSSECMFFTTPVQQ